MSTSNESQEQAPKTAGGKRRTSRRFTDEEKAKAVALAARVGVEAAAARTGVSPWTIYTWRTAYKLAPLVSGARPGTNDTPEPLSPSIQLGAVRK